MIIEIPDDASPSKRKKLLSILPVIYAMQLFKGKMTEAAKWLDISYRGLQYIFKRYDELKSFQPNPSTQAYFLDKGDINLINRLKQFHIKRTREKFWFNQMTEKEQKEVIERIKKLY